MHEGPGLKAPALHPCCVPLCRPPALPETQCGPLYKEEAESLRDGRRCVWWAQAGAVGTVGAEGAGRSLQHTTSPAHAAGFFKKEMNENRREGQGAGAGMRSMFGF